jgi:broad specificity phosphatase PhoE
VTVRIVLVRHGRPAGVETIAIPGRSVGEWVRDYDRVGIDGDAAPPQRSRQLSAAANVIVASDLRRARESAASLAGTRTVDLDSDLREAPLPASLGTSLKLPPGVWIVIARLAWLLNLGGASESLAETRMRAARMADRLIARAAEHGSVMAVGHGMFNRFVARELRRLGWRGPRAMPGGYWSAAEFEPR